MNERQQEIASAVPANLDDLPKLRGFRLRGIEMTRLETFIDAAFASRFDSFTPIHSPPARGGLTISPGASPPAVFNAGDRAPGDRELVANCPCSPNSTG